MKFGVNLKSDIVAVTDDGAPVMKKFGQQLKIPYVICSNHLIHLAVTDKLFEEKVEEANNLSDDEDHDEEDEFF